MKNVLQRLVDCGVSPDDSQDLIVRKQTLSLMAVIIGFAAAVWGSIYAFYGHYLSASIPSSYAVISAITLFYVSKTKKHLFLQNSQLVLVLILPFLLMWSLGGFGLGSYVMIWAFYAPLAALSFQQNRSVIWFGLFSLLTVFSAFIEHYLHTSINPLPEDVINSFMVLNVMAGFGGIFYMLHHHVKTQTYFAKKLEFLVDYDHLTQLLNRRSVERVMTQEFSRARRYEQPLSLVLLDIDNFKSINDTYGHNNGDQSLIRISKIISDSIRVSDHASRWGGEEFLLVLPQTSKSEAEIFANKLRIIISGCDFEFTDKVTCSFGVVVCDTESAIESCIHKADVALYRAKSEGKNCVKIWDKGLMSASG